MSEVKSKSFFSQTNTQLKSQKTMCKDRDSEIRIGIKHSGIRVQCINNIIIKETNTKTNKSTTLSRRVLL